MTFQRLLVSAYPGGETEGGMQNYQSRACRAEHCCCATRIIRRGNAIASTHHALTTPVVWLLSPPATTAWPPAHASLDCRLPCERDRNGVDRNGVDNGKEHARAARHARGSGSRVCLSRPAARSPRHASAHGVAGRSQTDRAVGSQAEVLGRHTCQRERARGGSGEPRHTELFLVQPCERGVVAMIDCESLCGGEVVPVVPNVWYSF